MKAIKYIKLRDRIPIVLSIIFGIIFSIGLADYLHELFGFQSRIEFVFLFVMIYIVWFLCKLYFNNKMNFEIA